MKIVVMTGATSFLGRNTLNGLLSRGYFIYALVRKESKFIQNMPSDCNVELIYGSLEDLGVICDYVEKAEYFIHFAWGGDGYSGRADRITQQKNIKYSMDALKIAKQIGCKKFVFAGSQAEYGIVHGKIYENTKCNPVSEYGKAKLKFSEIAKEFCADGELRFIHLRIFSVYGVGDRNETLINLCVKKFNNGETMTLGPCLQKWNYMNVADFVYIIIRIIENESAGGIYNVASKDTRIMREFVNAIYNLSNKKGNFVFTETAENPEGSPILDPDTDRITELFGDRVMVLFDDGIKEIMESENLM